MHVQIYDVQVPAKTTRFFRVPKYDIPVIRALWPASELMPGAIIQVTATGQTVPRSLYDEQIRLSKDYASVPNGGTAAAWVQVYGSKDALQRAYEEALGEGKPLFDAEMRRREAREAAAAAAEGLADDGGELAEDGGELVSVAAIAGEPASRRPAKPAGRRGGGKR